MSYHTLFWRPPADAHPATRRAATMLAHRGVAGPQGIAREFDHLDDVRRYLDTTDPMEIGAGYILEKRGHTRAQARLFP